MKHDPELGVRLAALKNLMNVKEFQKVAFDDKENIGN